MEKYFQLPIIFDYLPKAELLYIKGDLSVTK
jgi:hypothetical protein